MKNLYFLIISLLITGAISCSTVDVAISRKTDVEKKLNKVAVFPFDIKGAGWGDEFSDSLTHHFFKTGKVGVVERESIEKVLKEKRLSISGFIDQNKAVDIGKLLGADVIIIGRGSFLRVKKGRKEVQNLIDTFSLKVISVETGSLLITVRKEPGIAWNSEYRLKYCCSLGIIWNKRDILIESSRYDEISKQIVKNIIQAIKKIVEQKNLK